jgi:hypothetical protein
MWARWQREEICTKLLYDTKCLASRLSALTSSVFIQAPAVLFDHFAGIDDVHGEEQVVDRIVDRMENIRGADFLGA